jgi:hypothetical protein
VKKRRLGSVRMHLSAGLGSGDHQIALSIYKTVRPAPPASCLLHRLVSSRLVCQWQYTNTVFFMNMNVCACFACSSSLFCVVMWKVLPAARPAAIWLQASTSLPAKTSTSLIGACVRVHVCLCDCVLSAYMPV